jgi:hypothetical protein
MLVLVNKFGVLVMFGSFRKAWLLPVQQSQVAQLKIEPDTMQALEAGRTNEATRGFWEPKSRLFLDEYLLEIPASERSRCWIGAEIPSA